MRNLAEYILRGRKQAVLLALLFTILPLLGWVADAIVALVTLRKGAKEGAFVLLWVLLPSVVFAIAGYPQLWIYNILGGSLVTFVLALALRHYGNWSAVLQIGMLLGVLAVLLAHLWMPNLEQVWTQDIALYLKTLKEQSVLLKSFQQSPGNVQILAKIATGLQAAFLLLGDFFNVVMARWAQSLLYNPGGLRQELYDIRIGSVGVSVLILVVLGSLAGMSTMTDCLPVVILPIALAGISLVHGFVQTVKHPGLYLFLFYGLLVTLFPYFIGILVIIALLDSWLDLRQYTARI